MTASADMSEHELELLLAQRRLTRLLSVKAEAIKADGLKFFRPLDHQDKFFRAAATSNRRLMEGGNRSGKTTTGAAEDASFLRGERPFYPEGSPERTAGIPRHPVKMAVVTPDWEKTREVWTEEAGDNQGKLWKFLPRSMVDYVEHHQSGAVKSVTLKNGSSLKFVPVKAWKNDPMIAESSDYDAVHVDEPCPEQMFKGLARGLIDRKGSAWFTLTALTEPWIQDYFFPMEGDLVRDGAWAVRASIYENTYLDRTSIEEFAALLSVEERECRLLGIPLYLAGLVYKEYDQTRHVLVREPYGWDNWMPPAHWSHYFHIDPHPQTPHAVLFCAVSPLGQHFYYDEIFEQTTIEDLCMKIRRKLAGRNLVRGRVDPIAVIRDPITNTSIIREMARCGVHVTPATKDKSRGILNAKAVLRRDGAVFFSPECRRTLWEIRRYTWDEKTNKPVDKDDHMMENFYRMELDNMIWVDPASRTIPINTIEIPFAELEMEDLSHAVN